MSVHLQARTGYASFSDGTTFSASREYGITSHVFVVILVRDVLPRDHPGPKPRGCWLTALLMSQTFRHLPVMSVHVAAPKGASLSACSEAHMRSEALFRTESPLEPPLTGPWQRPPSADNRQQRKAPPPPKKWPRKTRKTAFKKNENKGESGAPRRRALRGPCVCNPAPNKRAWGVCAMAGIPQAAAGGRPGQEGRAEKNGLILCCFTSLGLARPLLPLFCFGLNITGCTGRFHPIDHHLVTRPFLAY
jgi:hypothetical protein